MCDAAKRKKIKKTLQIQDNKNVLFDQCMINGHLKFENKSSALVVIRVCKNIKRTQQITTCQLATSILWAKK